MATIVDSEFDPAALIAAMGLRARVAASALAQLATADKARGDEVARAPSRDRRSGGDRLGHRISRATASVAIVDGLGHALTHISRHGSQHTDAIIAEDADAAERSCAKPIARSCYGTPRPSSPTAASSDKVPRSASPRAAYARGPVAFEGLTMYKWIGCGTGQVWP